MTEAAYTPLVSVIMPIRNEASFIDKSLRAVLSQNYPANRMQIIIADGMSTDDTREIVSEISLKYPLHSIVVLDNHQHIVSIGLNLALRKSKGEIIVRVDGHTIIAVDYVEQCVAALQESQADNVGGRMNSSGTSNFGRAVALATSSPFGIGGARFHYSKEIEWVDTVYMGAWPRSLFEKNGLFDEEMVRDQDDEFNYRLRAAGGKILLSPSIKSHYTVRSSPGALWRQYYQYGYWKVRVLQKHPRQMRLRQFVPLIFVLSILFGIGLSLFLTFGKVILLAIVGSYLLVTMVASTYVASKKGLKYFAILPTVFSILHLSYGLGFLVGLISFASRWGDREGKAPNLDDLN